MSSNGSASILFGGWTLVKWALILLGLSHVINGSNGREWRNVGQVKPLVRNCPVQPIISILEPSTKSRVHLVGVSHGSAASATLVQETITTLDSKAVVLELCDDRFLSISLETRLEPRSNSTMKNIYTQKLEEWERSAPKSFPERLIRNLQSFSLFTKSRGLLIGSFVMMGVLASALQRIVRPFSKSDEFATAMKVAYDNNIEVRLGDAPQSDTLESVKKLISKDTINPSQVLRGSRMLLFSAFGTDLGEFPWKRRKLYPSDAISGKEWINIPEVYARNYALLGSLLPIIILLVCTSLFNLLSLSGMEQEFLPPLVSGQDITEMTSIVQNIVGSNHIPLQTLTNVGQVAVDTVNTGWEWLQVIAVASLPTEVEHAITLLIDAAAVLILIRLSKLIGTDRDKIIASKVQEVCREFPVSFIIFRLNFPHELIVHLFHK